MEYIFDEAAVAEVRIDEDELERESEVLSKLRMFRGRGTGVSMARPLFKGLRTEDEATYPSCSAVRSMISRKGLLLVSLEYICE